MQKSINTPRATVPNPLGGWVGRIQEKHKPAPGIGTLPPTTDISSLSSPQSLFCDI